MNRFDFDYSTGMHVPPAEHAPRYIGDAQNDRDERGSPSSSDDGNYMPYPDPLRPENDTDDDSMALTSQTLNADGTPKRPMNAFMIFARRRRPQVSTENQAMRTGEISKILSKEWNAMRSSEKQFYQDQAKQLKDSFNAKYPDYVYRRRPNNSRKRRKPDAPGGRITNNPLPLDGGDEMLGYGDVGESPTDTEGLSMLTIQSSPDVHRSRHSHDVQQGYNYTDQGKFNSSSRTSPYAYTIPDHPFRPDGGHDPRVAYFTSGSEQVPSSPSLSSPTSIQYQYSLPMQSRSHSQSHSAQSHAPIHPGGRESWDPAVVRPALYLGSGHSRSRGSRADPNEKPHTYSSASPLPPWQQASSTPSASAASPNFPLSTLNSPFHPHYVSNTASSAISTSSSLVSPSSYGTNQLQSGSTMTKDYNSQGHSSTSPTGLYPPSSDRVAPLYLHRQPDVPRGSSVSSGYPQPIPRQSSGPGLGIPHGYWARE